MSNKTSNVCGVYEDSNLLKGSRTAADLASIRQYCTYAMNFNYGPNPTNETVPQPACNCPFGYGYNNNAYDFQAGPSRINLGQALNYQKQNQAKSGGFVPASRSRYA